jgi:hypothetical protein
MKRMILNILGGLVILLVILGFILPQQGRMKHTIRWRTNNIEMWHKAVIDYIDTNKKFPDDLYQVYVSSCEGFKNTEFSTCIRSLDPDNIKEEMKNDKSLFDRKIEYRLMVLSKDIWYIMECPSFPREGDCWLMIDQDGKVWKATKQ